MLYIRWFGHAMWLIKIAGLTFVTDPFAEIGYPMPENLTADLVLVSHGHYDHSNVALVGGDPVVIREDGRYEVGDAKIEMIPVWHDEARGAKRGVNHLMVIDAGGKRIVHCGDLGHTPGDEVFERLGEVDVLMVPVGGYYTIDAQTAFAIVQRLKPTVVLPMHYKTSVLDFPIATVEPFARLMGDVRVVEDNHATLEEEDFATPQTIIMGFK